MRPMAVAATMASPAHSLGEGARFFKMFMGEGGVKNAVKLRICTKGKNVFEKRNLGEGRCKFILLDREI